MKVKQGGEVVTEKAGHGFYHGLQRKKFTSNSGGGGGGEGGFQKNLPKCSLNASFCNPHFIIFWCSTSPEPL